MGLTVATIGEAEVFAAAGVDDLFIAYPIWADAARGARLRALTDKAALRIGVDSVEAAEQLGRALAGTSAQIVVEVDCGHHRSGVSPDAVAEVAAAAGRAGLDVVGVFTFPGHSYAPSGGRSRAAADEANALGAAATALSRAGIEPRCAAEHPRRVSPSPIRAFRMRCDPACTRSTTRSNSSSAAASGPRSR